MTRAELESLVDALARREAEDRERLARGRRRDARWYLCRLHQQLEELDFALIERRDARPLAIHVAVAALRLAELQAAEIAARRVRTEAPGSGVGSVEGPAKRDPEAAAARRKAGREDPLGHRSSRRPGSPLRIDTGHTIDW